jgi:hypothetical protein
MFPGTTERRVNLLVSTIDVKYLFAGYMSVFNLALRLHASRLRSQPHAIANCNNAFDSKLIISSGSLSD